MRIRCVGSSLPLSVPRLLSLLLLVSGLSAEIKDHRLRTGLPQDWTHRHVVFNRRAIAQHPELSAREPRVLHQFLREARARFPFAGVAAAPETVSGARGAQRDWNVSLGTGSAGVVPAGMSPAKYSFDINAAPDCANDYVAFGLNVPGVTGGQANLIAFNDLYSGTGGLCGAAPSVLFSYNITTVAGGLIATSPVLSLDGTKIAFVESAPGISIFHVLTWASGPGNGTSATSSAAPGAGNSASMTSLVYASQPNDRSSPWVDYANDVAYVGANTGEVYKITGIFTGTPTLAGAPWPIMIQPNRRLTSPVLDQLTRNLFIGDPRGLLSMVNADTPGVPVRLAVGLFPGQNPGIVDAPLVDALNGTAFAISSDDGTSAVVVQADTTTLAQLARTRIGGGSTLGPVNVNMYDGAFDNNYFNDPESGFLLVCGSGVTDTSPWRYAFGFTGRVLNTGPSASSQIVSSLRARCSPITEFFNPNVAGGTDFFFWGLTADCTGPSTPGCVVSFSIPVGLTRVNQPGGTSAIIIDNVSTAPQASSIYFTDQGGPRRAIKLTQDGLQ